MRWLIALAAMGIAGQASAQEVEITFYLQPDTTGQNTLNKSIALDDDGELTIEESRNDAMNLYDERDATEDEAAFLHAFVRERIESFDFSPSPDVDQPRVEIQFEYETESRKIEAEERYPAGAVPEIYLELQARFFQEAFR